MLCYLGVSISVLFLYQYIDETYILWTYYNERSDDDDGASWVKSNIALQWHFK